VGRDDIGLLQEHYYSRCPHFFQLLESTEQKILKVNKYLSSTVNSKMISFAK